MKNQRNNNKACELEKYITSFNEMQKSAEADGEDFKKAYDRFKKEYGLDNLYFSRLVHFVNDDYMFLDVWYSISDMFLTYLNANDILPESVSLERYTIKESYFYESQEYKMFQDSTSLAMVQQVEPEIICGRALYRPESLLGLTEIIKLSSTANIDSGVIIGRIPMAFNDLKNLDAK